MVEEFLAVALDGAPPRDASPVEFAPQVAEALADVEAAFDYGLLGLQAHFVAFSHWPQMTGAIDRMADLTADLQGVSWDRLRVMAGQVKAGGYHATEALRDARTRNYAQLARACNDGLPLRLQTAIPQVWADAATRATFTAMSGVLGAHLRAELGDGPRTEALQAALEDFAMAAHAQLRVATDIQAKLNARIGRPQPSGVFRAQDMQIHLLIQGREEPPMPHLIDLLGDLIGLNLTISREGIGLDVANDIGPARPAAGPKDFVGIPPAKERAPQAHFWREP
jgi:hypothetical protein